MGPSLIQASLHLLPAAHYSPGQDNIMQLECALSSLTLHVLSKSMQGASQIHFREEIALGYSHVRVIISLQNRSYKHGDITRVQKTKTRMPRNRKEETEEEER